MSIVLALAAAVAPTPAPPPDERTRERLSRAVAAYEKNDCPGTLRAIQPELKPGGAEAMEESVGAAVLTLGFVCEATAGRNDSAHKLAVRATRMGATEASVWEYRIGGDVDQKRYADAVSAVEELGAGRAATLNMIEPRVFWALSRSLADTEQGALRRRLLKVMAESYSPDQEVGSADPFRVAYARLLATDGDLVGARALLQGLVEPLVLREVMVDPLLRSGLPAGFDIRAATERRLDDQLAYVRSHPDQLAAVVEATALMRQLGKPADALRLLEETRAKVAGTAFKDAARFRIWWWDSLSRTQNMMGRVDDAAASLRTAIPMGEDGGKNVSHIINLMQVLTDAGRAREALAVPAEVGGLGSMSPYGELQLRRARGCAYWALGQKAEAQTDVAFVRERKLVDPETYSEMLLCTGDQDGAAAELIRQLDNPEQRIAALQRASTYAAPPPEMPVPVVEKAFVTLVARPDVQAALARAGGPRDFNVQRTEH